MKQLVTTAIILNRTDYGEADRILTLLTPQYGKLSLLAKGVRRIKSKLAGGIELFSVSDITFMRGRGEVGTLVSTRLVRHYDHIVTDLDRTMLGYEIIKQMHRATEDEPEASYFDLLQEAFEALDRTGISIPLIRFWFAAQLLRLGGHTPNLREAADGVKLDSADTYQFDHNTMSFKAVAKGPFGAAHIKYLRLVFAGNTARVLQQVQSGPQLLQDCTALMQTMLQTHIRSKT